MKNVTGVLFPSGKVNPNIMRDNKTGKFISVNRCSDCQQDRDFCCDCYNNSLYKSPDYYEDCYTDLD